MITEKQDNSGRFTKIVRIHKCSTPDADEAAREYAPGTEWTCNCGQVFCLSESQRDGYYWISLMPYVRKNS